tara:strand:- start:432 stop:716 length:285 start_codon:yes stop_codon:yes gene_type:complete
MSNNKIVVKNNLKVSDILTKKESERNDYIEGVIELNDMNKIKNYDVMICKLNNNTFLLKPIKKYNCYVFEDLFGFGYECDKFDLDKIIKINYEN